MRALMIISLTLVSLANFGQNFIGEITGKMVENGIPSDFKWEFQEDKTIYTLEFQIEHEDTKVVITFDGDTTAHIETFHGEDLVNSTPVSVSQLLSPMPVIVDQYTSEGVVIMEYNTQKNQVRTEDKEVAVWIADLSVDWHGAQYFFRDDIGFLVASEVKGNFPLKSISTDLMGNLKKSFEVTSIKEK